MNTGTILSGIGHAALILWVMLGDWLFAAREVPEIAVADVSFVTEAELEAMTVAATASDTPPVVSAEVESPVTPQPEEAPPSEPAPEEPPEQPPAVLTQPVRPVEEEEPEAQDDPEPVPAEPPPDDVEPVSDPEPVTEDALVTDNPQPELVLESVAPVVPDVRPRPKPASVIAPEVVDAPEENSEIVNETVPEVTETPAEEPPEVVPEEPVVATDTGETTETEANTDDVASTLAPTSSGRPLRRPEAETPPEETEVAAETPEEPAETGPDTSAEDAALAAALAEAQAAEEPSGPTGPPMSASESGNLRSAIQKCWNVGSLSTEATRTRITVFVDLSPDGKPIPGSISLQGFENGSEAAAQQAFEAAKRAIARCGVEGFPVPPEKYEHWKELQLNFDASAMVIR